MHPPRRLLRSAVSAGTATALGAGGHTLAGGSVGVGAVVVALAVSVVIAWSVAGGERGPWVIGALQVGLQQLVHTSLAWGEVPGGDGILPHELMLHAHVVAGLLTALLLRAGERRVWASARRVAARVVEWCRRIVPGPQRAVVVVLLPVSARCAPAPHRMLRHALVLRGPPAVTA